MQQEEEQGGQAKERELYYVRQREFDLSVIETGPYFESAAGRGMKGSDKGRPHGGCSLEGGKATTVV